MPRRIATKDTSRPIPQNNTIEASGVFSDFFDGAAADVVTRVEKRTTFDMSGSPI